MPTSASIAFGALGVAAGIFIGVRLSARNRVSNSASGESAGPSFASLNRKNGNGRVVVVTGGSRGIGAAICRQLGAAGYNVAVVYRSDLNAAKQVVADIVAKGGKATAFKCDVGSEDQVVALFAAVKETLGTFTFGSL